MREAPIPHEPEVTYQTTGLGYKATARCRSCGRELFAYGHTLAQAMDRARIRLRMACLRHKDDER